MKETILTLFDGYILPKKKRVLDTRFFKLQVIYAINCILVRHVKQGLVPRFLLPQTPLTQWLHRQS
jgi:hypothetical protein